MRETAERRDYAGSGAIHIPSTGRPRRRQSTRAPRSRLSVLLQGAAQARLHRNTCQPRQNGTEGPPEGRRVQQGEGGRRGPQDTTSPQAGTRPAARSAATAASAARMRAGTTAPARAHDTRVRTAPHPPPSFPQCLENRPDLARAHLIASSRHPPSWRSRDHVTARSRSPPPSPPPPTGNQAQIITPDSWPPP